MQAKKLLDDCKIKYEVVMVDEDMVARTWLLDQGHRSIPQVYKDGKLFVQGGVQGLLKAHREGSLENN